MIINKDYRHFKGDRPWRPHKLEGVRCEGCGYYEPVEFRILIIKLEAIGDVLRTTCILPGLKEKYLNSWRTWVTEGEASSFFKNNPLVDEVIEYASPEMLKLQAVDFDLVVNLDAAPKSALIATLARGSEKLGYALNKLSYVQPLNPEAEEWFEMGVFDDIKKENRKTYQQIALEICRLPVDSNHEPVLNLTESERRFAGEFAVRHRLQGEGPVIGFNTGAGGRWEHKKWTVEGYLALADLFIKKIGCCKILLYGGPEEEDRNDRLKRMLPGLIDTGCRNSLREFASLVDLCDVLVTGDTLAMHLSIALKKNTIVLFGPTSHTEIELYGRGEKVVSPLPCICCYRTSCDLKPNCMEAIVPERVFEAVTRCLEPRL
jgi:heptosyltransferase-2